MSPVIRVDNEVYSWLQSKARAFEDTPNSVLRRIAGFEGVGTDAPEHDPEIAPNAQPPEEPSMPASVGIRLTGDLLARRWKVNVRHALYHKDGTWYNNLRRFPGALFDPKGYVVFKTEDEYRRCPQISIGQETNVRPHISLIAGYVRMER